MFSTADPRLAVLVGAPHRGDTSVHCDVVAMHNALLARGLGSSEISVVEGLLGRRSLLSFLRDVGRRVSTWTTGEVFLYVSGHGGFTGSTTGRARLYVDLGQADSAQGSQRLFWEEIMRALAAPIGVGLTLLPDH